MVIDEESLGRTSRSEGMEGDQTLGNEELLCVGIFEYLHNDKGVKDDEWGRDGRLGLGSRGNTTLLIGCLPWVHRVFLNDICEFEMLKSRCNDEMKAERSSYSTHYDWHKMAHDFQIPQSVHTRPAFTTGAGLVLTGNSGPCPGARRRI